ncbi:MAG: hypothetical protein IKU59_02100 [Bacteroidales bacterium]|nr:hypothetical protein [Bacteroidales bacterium]
MENKKDDVEEKKVITINLGYIFGIIMIVAYFGFAYLLVFTDVFSNSALLTPVTRYIFAVIFVVYAIFRAYRFIKYRGYKKS